MLPCGNLRYFYCLQDLRQMKSLSNNTIGRDNSQMYNTQDYQTKLEN
ncbi:unnamed protein product [Paramecium sonneborni]|uniref:Uncharacterized protein n=1 Tax=Paramecium sonneborni TaxID=65129 RepID=A0A8S1R5D5_9CILI|nr:unnamed protein product [Paramecium sonneborni]